MQLYSQCCKTAHRALQWRFMRLSPPILKRYQTDTIDYNATCATLERTTATGRPAPIPDTSATSDAVQARQRSRLQTMPARRGQLLPSADRWQVLRPAHLLTGQCLHLYRVSPASVSMLPAPGGSRPGTGSAVRVHRVYLAQSTRRGSPAAGARLAARNH